MAIPLSCACGKTYRLKDELAGKRVKCLQCGCQHDVPLVDFEVVEDDFEVVAQERPKPAPASEAVRAEGALPRREPTPVVNTVDDEDYEPRRRRRRPRYRKRQRELLEFSGISISPGALGGTLMMLTAVVWFVCGLYFGWLFFYPPVLFILGVVTLVTSLTRGDR